MKLADDCHRCRLRETATQVVWGEGPLSARGALFGEAPGREEDRDGTPFIGKAGREMDHVLRSQGAPRRIHYISNIVKCRPPNNRDPYADEIEACSHWIKKELELLDELRVIGSVGLPSTRFFLGPSFSMEVNHGIMYGSPLLGHLRVVPIFHPAAGLRDQAVMMNVLSDLHEYVRAVRGQKEVGTVKDEWEGAENYHVAPVGNIILPNQRLVALDTEDDEDGSPWSVQYTFNMGGGVLVRASNTLVIRALRRHVARPDVITVLHNAMHDLPVLAQLGIFPANVRDTMVMAYLLQTEPQGLKPLAYRHAGMTMQDYSEIVAPSTHRKALDYLERACAMDWPDPPAVLEWRKGEPHVRQPLNMSRRLKTAITKVREKGADPWEIWHGMKDRDQVEEKLGPMRPGFLRDVPRKEAIRYAARDPDATLRVYHALWPRINALGLRDTFDRDMRAMRLVIMMQSAGMPIDPPKFAELSNYFQEKMDGLEMAINRYAGSNVNPGSNPQISTLLFKDLGLKPIKHGKTGPSADDSVLARLEPEHPVITDIRDWRSYHKLKTSYSDVIPGKAKAGRIYSTIRMTRVITGRLSSSDPNLMAQPVRTKEGRMIRDGYLAEDGFTFLSADYSQIEMRVTAHCSQDREMCKIFWGDRDIHTQTAMAMFGIPERSVNEMQHRYPAKRIGFGVLTDIQAPGLQRELLKEGAPPKIWGGKQGLERCGALIERWHEIYEGVARWKERHKTLARRHLFVRDEIQGRLRYVPGVRSPSRWVRLDAEHAAVSGPIQMGAQAIIKEAMGQLVEPCLDFGVRPLIQIHDDIVFEVPEEYVDYFARVCADIMANAITLSIPVIVDVKVGKRWGSMEKWEEGQ